MADFMNPAAARPRPRYWARRVPGYESTDVVERVSGRETVIAIALTEAAALAIVQALNFQREALVRSVPSRVPYVAFTVN